MTFRLEDFRTGDLVRDTSDEISEIVMISPIQLYARYLCNGHIFRLLPIMVEEIVEVASGKRKIKPYPREPRPRRSQRSGAG